MIISTFLAILGRALRWLFSLLPSWNPPAWLTAVGDYAGTIASSLSGSSAFLPWNVLFIAIGLVLGTYVVAAGVRGFRIMASFLTLGGGS